jgi:ATP-dependent exoDNAse (exonuclease V) beta subunit
VVRKARKSEAKEARLLDVFENRELGRPAARQPERRAPSAPVEVLSVPGRPESRFEALKPTYASYFETAQGELVHAMLSGFKELPAALEPALNEAFDELAPGYPFKFDRAKVVGGLLAFLNNPEAAALFAAAPGRETLIEAEFIDRNGSLFRMDRVLVDPSSVTVIDFKTGHENTPKYSAQMKNYLAIVSEVYNKPAKALLAYVDLGKIILV